MRQIAFRTLGCKVNQYETEALKERFTEAGYQVVDEDQWAHVYVINTCTVTGLADRKSRQYIRRVKKNNPDSLVAVVGCYAQVSPEEVAAIEGVSLVVGTNEKQNLLEYIEEKLANQDGTDDKANGLDVDQGHHDKVYVRQYKDLKNFEELGQVASAGQRTRAYIKIQEGCDRFCTYCIIPYARGPVRSRRREDILAEAKALVDKGFKELILTGINTALYQDLHGLLKELDSMEGQFRIRLSSLEPTVVDKEFVEEIIKSKRLCHHLHLSIQSGSTKVLKAMGRSYTKEEYLAIADILKDFDPLYGITTDIIVGFPGEEEEDYLDSVDVIEKVDFSAVHVFPYSKRSGTVAAKMPDQVHPTIKKERSKDLAQIGQEGCNRFFEKNQGTTQRVLFEEEESGYQTGYTDNYIKAYIVSPEDLTNQMIDVKIGQPFRDGVMVQLVGDK